MKWSKPRETETVTSEPRPRDRGLDKAFRQQLERKGLVEDAEKRRYCTGKSFVRDEFGEKLKNPDGTFRRKPCENRPIRGGFVCRVHGGTAKQVRAAADRRMQDLIDPAISAMEELIAQKVHMPTRLGAAVQVLKQQRVIKPDSAQGSGSGGGVKVVIGMKFGGLSTGKPEVAAALLTDGGVHDAEIVDGDDDDQA